MKYRNSFSARLSFYILSITALLFLIVLVIIGISSHKLIMEEASQSASNALHATIGDIDHILRDVESATNNTAWMVKKYDNPEYLYEITQELVSKNPNIVGSTIAFEPFYYPNKGEWFAPYSYKEENTGEIQTIQLGNEENDYLAQEWYLVPKLTKTSYWSDPYYDIGGGKQLMSTYSVPLCDDNGEVYAILTADISLKKTTEKINAMRPYKNSYTILVAKNGSFICHKDHEKLLKETIFTSAIIAENKSAFDIGKRMVSGETGNGAIKHKHKKDNEFVVFGSMENGWSAAIICPYTDILARALEMNLILTLVFSFGLLLLFVLCLRIIHKLTRPLTEFSEVAEEIAKGNMAVTLPEKKTNDEMGKLHDSFVYMQKSLSKYIQELKTTTAKKERIESELNIARNIQSAMIPNDFAVTDLCNIYGSMVPAKEVGGDMFDFIIKENKLYFAIGDVSGKGVPAALYMAISSSAFRFVCKMNLSVNEIVSLMNNSLSQKNKYDIFITFFLGCIDLKTGEFNYCNAGHNPIIVAPPDENPYYLDVKANLTMGLFEDFPYEMQTTTLKKGSSLLLYTDGVTEAETTTKDQYGEERLLEWSKCLAKSDESAENLTENLAKEVHQFTNGAEQNDDVTILILKNIGIEQEKK